MTTLAGHATETQEAGINDPLTDILAQHSTVLRDIRPLQIGMITAIQPLTIDGKEICSDTILAELVTYRSIDELKRETETLPLKKTTFCDFEASMTAIPKYCYSDHETLQTVLVHAVPRITLDDILTWCESRYPEPYPCAPFRLYADWCKKIVARMTAVPAGGPFGFLRKAVSLPKLFFPPPAHIGQKQRISLVNIIIRQVLAHHDKGIFHDCISDRTIFFPTAAQPKLLANYAGIPSATLADHLPAALLTDDAARIYGRQVCDVYGTALFCYRILTGEHIDGRAFTLDVPRPAGMVLRTITLRTRFSFSFRSLRTAGHSIVSLIRTIRALMQQVPLLLSSSSFVTWRKINRATGGLWRSIPVLGPLGNIIHPTPAARALRTVLDRHWFEHALRKRKSASPPAAQAGPDIHVLAAAFTGNDAVPITHFTAAFNALASEALLRRQTFGTLMEGMARPQRTGAVPGRRTVVLTVTLLVVMITALLFLLRKMQESSISGTAPEMVVTPTIHTMPSSIDIPAAPATAADTAVTAGAAVQNVPAESPDVRHTADRLPQVRKTTPETSPGPPAPAVIPVHRPAVPQTKHTTIPVKTVAVQPPPPAPVDEEVPPAPPPPPGLLIEAEGTPNVYIVDGTEEPCNPAQLVFASTVRKQSAAFVAGRLTDEKLYLCRLTGGNFGSIITIRKCRSDDCDPTLYYTTTGLNRVDRPVHVQKGDIISPSGYALRRYIRDRRHMDNFQR